MTLEREDLVLSEERLEDIRNAVDEADEDDELGRGLTFQLEVARAAADAGGAEVGWAIADDLTISGHPRAVRRVLEALRAAGLER